MLVTNEPGDGRLPNFAKKQKKKEEGLQALGPVAMGSNVSRAGLNKSWLTRFEFFINK